MYQVVIESFLGLKREGSLLFFKPCVPANWESFEIDYRYNNTTYHIKVMITKQQSASVKVDGLLQGDQVVKLVDDNKDHNVEIVVRASEMVNQEGVMEMAK
jgi:cyclic beta-1,2-glucan synthetase